MGNDCFPRPFTALVDVNSFSRAFRAKFLLAGYWNDYGSSLPAVLVFLGLAHMALAVTGLVRCAVRRYANEQEDEREEDVAQSLMLPVLMFFWQLWLGLMFATLPSTWLSGVTIGFIFFHTIAEFSAFAVRWAIVSAVDGKRSIAESTVLTVKWLAVIFTPLAMLLVLTDSPYWKGILDAVPTLLADFGNLILAPALFYLLYSRQRHTMLEAIALLMAYLHVIVFYVQGLIACLVSVYAAGVFVVTLAGVNVLVMAVYLRTFWDVPIQVDPRGRVHLCLLS